MSDKPPVTFYDSNFDLSPIPYVEGYDDPDANVVFVCLDKKAMRVHDYYLKAESTLFRDMFQAGTRGGPIGIDEVSQDFAFILDRVTRRQSVTMPREVAKPKLSEIIRLEPITRKYMFEATNALLRRLIARYAVQCPPQALGYALSCQPPDRSIAMSALENFDNEMASPAMAAFFISATVANFKNPGQSAIYYSRRVYSPAAHNLRKNFVKDQLGVEGYHAYSLALQKGRLKESAWDWKKVAQAFVEQLELPEVEEWSC